MIEIEPTLLPGAMCPARVMAVSPNGLRLACVTMDDSLVIWDLAQRVILARHADVGADAIVWPSDATLLIGRYEGVDELEALSGARVGVWDREQFGFVDHLAKLADGTVAATGAELVVLLDGLEAVGELGPWPHERGWNEQPRLVEAHPDGTAFALAFDDHGRIIDRAGEELAWFDGVRAMRFSSDGGALLTMGYSESTLYDWPQMTSARPLPFRLDDARSVPAGWLGWDHQSAVLFEAGGDEVWSSRYYDGIDTIAVHMSRFYTGSSMQWIGVRDIEAGELLTILPAGGGQRIDAIAFDDGGDHVIAADSAGRVTVWDFRQGRARAMIDTSSLQGPDAVLEVATLRNVENLWVADDALHIVSGKHYAWPDVTATDLGTTPPTEAELYLAELSVDREHALIEDYESEVTFLVRLEDGGRIAVLPPYDRYDERVVIEAGARRLLFVDVAGEGTTLRIWDVERSRYEQELHIDLPTEHVTFEPGGAVVGWVSTDPIFDWDEADEDVQRAPSLFFRWEPETGDVMRWFEAPGGCGGHWSVIFGTDVALFGGRGPAMLLDLRTLQTTMLTSQPADCATLHDETGRIAIGIADGVIALIDRQRDTTTLVCTTADGSTWSLRDGDLELHPSTWAKR